MFGITDLTIRLNNNSPLKPSHIQIIKKENKKDLSDLYKSELGFEKKFLDYVIKKKKNTSHIDIYEPFANPYALLTISNITRRNIYKDTGVRVSSIPNLEPKELTRAYFKLWEMILEFDLLPKDGSFVSGNIAEGPGGFINAVVDWRRKYGKDYESNKVFGITLVSHVESLLFESEIAQTFMKKYRNDLKIVTISKGANGTGDINKLENILDFKKHFKKKADFVSGDGGINTDTHKEVQEAMSSQLLYNQIITALTIQKKKGNAVIKCYSIMTDMTAQCIYLLTTCYNEVYITKPITSKITNNEHYLVCKGFLGIPALTLKKLYTITTMWNKNSSTPIIKFINDKELYSKIYPVIKKYNDDTLKYYYETLDKIFYFIEQSNNNNNHKHELIKMAKINTDIAIEWCKEYDIPYNIHPKKKKKRNIS